MEDLNTVYKDIIKHYISPQLSRSGFKKFANGFTRHGAHVTHIIAVQRSQWNESSKLSFTINLGIYVPGYIASYGGIPDPVRPKEVDCCLRLRLESLSSHRAAQWWEITSASNDEHFAKVGTEIASDIENLAMPFFAKFQELKDVIEYLETPLSEREVQLISPMRESVLQCLAVLWHLQGNSVKSQECLSELIANTKNKDYRERMRDLLRHLSSS